MNKAITTAVLFLLTACHSFTEKDKTGIVSDKQRMKMEESDDPVTERRIDSLMREMTLEEKAGQMLHINFIGIPPDSIPLPEGYPVLDTAKLISYMDKYGIGFMINDMPLSPGRWIGFMKQLQEVYMRYSRLKIPFIYAICHQHGASFMDDATIFPHNINLAATFDTLHAYNSGHVTTLETADLGHNFIYVPVVDLGRNPCWSRFYETFGESYLVCSKMGKSIVYGIQDNPEIKPYKIAACAKHFLGYSDPESNWDRTPAYIPDQEIYEFFVPSFKACVEAGVKIIEANSSEVNGVPVHCSYPLLTTLLRDYMGFKGVLNSDYTDVIRLVTHHGVASNEKEATYMALNAGIDCVLTPNDFNFAKYTCELVREGRISEDRINLSVKRILRLKFQLGLFDGNFQVRDDRFKNIRREDSRQKALEAARQSIVLLKNTNRVLPLDVRKCRTILVAGPNANSRNNIAGGWTYKWQAAGNLIPQHVKTIYQAIGEKFPNTYVKLAGGTREIITQGSKADAIVYVAGEKPYAENLGSMDDLNLPEEQIAEIQAALSTHKPVILIMVAGRPRLVSKVYDHCHAFIWAGLPGYEGGTAIAEILNGETNPSGKLPFAYPYAISHIINYNHKFGEEMQIRERNARWTIADLGSGLSYTQFSYGKIHLSDTVIRNHRETITAEVEVTNTGPRDGYEAVLWFIRDETGSVTRPIRELKHFEKKLIKKGETRKFIFMINPDHNLSFPDATGNILLEKGFFTLHTNNQHARFRLDENNY